MTKRSYNRRTEEDRIRELEEKLAKVRARLETKQRKDSPVLREAAKIQRSLRKFIQLAQDNGRSDLALSVQAFSAGLDRSVSSPPQEEVRRRARSVGAEA
jgi:hypothetical protein